MISSYLRSGTASAYAVFVCFLLSVFLCTFVLSMNVSQPTEDLRDVYLNECKVYDQYGAFIDNLEYRTTIEILSLMPCRNTLNLMEGECDFLDYLPILAMVEDEINAKPNILPGYKLKLANVNSGVSAAVRLLEVVLVQKVTCKPVLDEMFWWESRNGGFFLPLLSSVLLWSLSVQGLFHV